MRVRRVHGLRRIVALTAPGNARSIQILAKPGLRYERTVTLQTATRESQLFAWKESGASV